MSPSKYREALDAYSGLMEEAKYRLQAMDTALIGITGLPRGAIVEFGFLQLRLLCELIAVGCLTAHGDLQTGKLKKAYEADKIIKGLERLRSKFYPLGAIRTGDLIKLRRDGFLTKEELLKLYWSEGTMKTCQHGYIRRSSLKRLELGSRRSRPCLAVMRSSWLITEQWCCSSLATRMVELSGGR
jgi:hypothetical protein